MDTNKYRNGKIYKIVDIDYNKCYIGSSCKSLSQRMAHHRNDYKAMKEGRRYTNTKTTHLFDEFGVENCKIELIEEYPCESKEQLLQREGHHIKNTECINRHVMGRTQEEYYMDNKDYILQRCRKYYEGHKEGISKRAKQYRLNNKEVMAEYFKQYYLNNKEKKASYIKQYRLENLTNLRERANVKYVCSICSGKYTHSNKVQHEKSRMHQLALQPSTVENK